MLKSISKDCVVLNQNNWEVLFSYGIPVAAFVSGKGYVKTEEKHSRTTSKHINKWLEDVKAKEMPQEFFNKLVEIKIGK